MTKPVSAMLPGVDAASGINGGRQFQQPARIDARTLALAVPAYAAVAILVAAWDHDLAPAELERYRHTMLTVLELAAAALGKIEARSSLERLS
jgi:hypothetical protein